jgi:hypothetical protein
MADSLSVKALLHFSSELLILLHFKLQSFLRLALSCSSHPCRRHHATVQACLGLAFSVEGILVAFHLKGTSLEWNAHFMLALLIAACAIAVFLEAAWPEAIILSLTRCYFVLLQGTWFCHIGRILFLGNPWWDDSDMSYMGASMFLPVVFVTHLLCAALGLLLLYLIVAFFVGGRAAAQRGSEAAGAGDEAGPFKFTLLDLSMPASRSASFKVEAQKQ